MRKTKIVCTLGPSTDNENTLRSMIKAGMNVARFNFSHANHDEHLARLKMLQKIRTELKVPVAALLDTKGPEVRLKSFKDGKAFLEAGTQFILTSNEVLGDNSICSITYKGLINDVDPGTRILLDDGLIALEVERLEKENIVCRVKNSGPIKDNKGVNVPGVKLSMPYLSVKDKDDIVFGIKSGFDFIAASFVSCAHDILEIRQILDRHKCEHIKIIAKIENHEGVDNLDEILGVSDGIMIARGDMGVEIDFAEIPAIQKKIIQYCYNMGKPVITATQMLDSMMNNPRPTRAEITDVANAIYDGTSAIMLSGETAAGKYPVEAVATMHSIAQHTEADINYNKRLRQRETDGHLCITDAVAHAACSTAMDISAKAIVTVSKSGETCRLICKYRPEEPIIACVIDEFIYRHLALSWGVYPLMMPIVKSTDELINKSVEIARAAGYLTDGDLVVITAGVPAGISGTTNMIKAHLVGDSLISGVGIGKVFGSGKLCICANDEDVHAKFKPGDILVVPATSNDILDHMREASAIITEEPGRNSHAAIVGLTLGKPVIVGATGATKKLKQGLLVTVDAERGIVRTMPN
ncbi:MAG: pyruvate kinase [Oscillospiraceae bacterium]|nr:pyruvate kinase [Oscillospiraceae bacterium]